MMTRDERCDQLYDLTKDIALIMHDDSLPDHTKILGLEALYRHDGAEHGFSRAAAERLYAVATDSDDQTLDGLYDTFVEEYFDGDVETYVEHDDITEYIKVINTAAQ